MTLTRRLPASDYGTDFVAVTSVGRRSRATRRPYFRSSASFALPTPSSRLSFSSSVNSPAARLTVLLPRLRCS